MTKIDNVLSITVNQSSVELAEPMTIEQMLSRVDVPPNYLAVEVNGEVLPREEHARTMVSDGDVFEVVTLVGGG